jgi:hypothetical protein
MARSAATSAKAIPRGRKSRNAPTTHRGLLRCHLQTVVRPFVPAPWNLFGCPLAKVRSGPVGAANREAPVGCLGASTLGVTLPRVWWLNVDLVHRRLWAKDLGEDLLLAHGTAQMEFRPPKPQHLFHGPGHVVVGATEIVLAPDMMRGHLVKTLSLSKADTTVIPIGNDAAELVSAAGGWFKLTGTVPAAEVIAALTVEPKKAEALVLRKMNNRMEQLLPSLPRRSLSADARSRLVLGLTEQHRCLLRNWGPSPSGQEGIPDPTSYEASMNKLQIGRPGMSLPDMAADGVAALEGLRLLILAFPKAGPVQAVLSVGFEEPPSVIVRFYRRRPGARWLADNLEDYADEAVLVEDIN